MVRTYRDRGVVLRTYPIGEADRVVVVLSLEHGQVHAVAKGVRRTTSRFGSRLEALSVIDFQAHRGRSLDTLTQVETVAPLGMRLAADYESYTAGTVMAETAQRLTGEDPDTAAHYRLLYGALGALDRRVSDPRILLSSYLLRVLAIAGWAPALDHCATCGRGEGLVAFSLSGGGALCESCQGLGAQRIRADVLALLVLLARGDWAGIGTPSEALIARCARLASTWTQWQLERRLKSVAVWERGA
ncbi:DNA repair protein RecO [Nanchangia anserum]|uniref:DNA repair protein RecO n=1 Tax=Nanchangia anserum TaxID=2692125 RepID=A0A8I0G760_9ACTO|nr:DNA repair protein RecO [Nanchangia anserum]MBD3689085.1 DNA repair protein RecO [Nanchangia anserum]QOX81323.1 DNA repair protein RecO [Nanchangia anserum]